MHLCATGHVMKACRGVEVKFHAVLTLALDQGERSASRTNRFTLQEKRPRYPLNRRLAVPHSRFGRFGEQTSVVPCGNGTPDRRARSLVAVRSTRPRVLICAVTPLES